MITVYWMDFAVNLVTFLLAYLVSVTLVGCFRAWMAGVWGDDTPERLGFLTLNMMQHIDPIGLLCLLFFDAGWGRYIPVNPSNISGRYQQLKRFLVQYSDTIGFLTLALVFQTAVVIFIPGAPRHVITFMLHAYLGPAEHTSSQIAAVCEQGSTFFYSIGYFLQGFALANAFLAALSCVVNTTAIIIGALFDPLRSSLTEQLLALGISLVLFFFGLPYIRHLVMLFLVIASELVSTAMIQCVTLIQSIGA